MVTVEITSYIETNYGPLNPGDMIDCHYVDLDNENKIISCTGINETSFDIPMNACRIIPENDFTQALHRLNNQLLSEFGRQV